MAICSKCQDMLDTRKRHEDLLRVGLYKAVGHHGCRDDEYRYECRKCGSKYIGDSCGTWSDRSLTD